MIPQIRVQLQDFSLDEEYARLSADASIGAIVAFVGRVRDSGGVALLELEHYPAMTQKSLTEIAKSAMQRWSLQAITIIHRFGPLHAGEQIVLVLTASQHRQAAYEANAFIMDYLKTEAPFWKREHTAAGAGWVDAKESDDQARQRWEAK